MRPQCGLRVFNAFTKSFCFDWITVYHPMEITTRILYSGFFARRRARSHSRLLKSTVEDELRTNSWIWCDAESTVLCSLCCVFECMEFTGETVCKIIVRTYRDAAATFVLCRWKILTCTRTTKCVRMDFTSAKHSTFCCECC